MKASILLAAAIVERPRRYGAFDGYRKHIERDLRSDEVQQPQKSPARKARQPQQNAG